MFTHLVNCKNCNTITEHIVPIEHKKTVGNTITHANASRPPICIECLSPDKKQIVKIFLKKLEDTLLDEPLNHGEQSL